MSDLSELKQAVKKELTTLQVTKEKIQANLKGDIKDNLLAEIDGTMQRLETLKKRLPLLILTGPEKLVHNAALSDIITQITYTQQKVAAQQERVDLENTLETALIALQEAEERAIKHCKNLDELNQPRPPRPADAEHLKTVQDCIEEAQVLQRSLLLIDDQEPLDTYHQVLSKIMEKAASADPYGTLVSDAEIEADQQRIKEEIQAMKKQKNIPPLKTGPETPFNP